MVILKLRSLVPYFVFLEPKFRFSNLSCMQLKTHDYLTFTHKIVHRMSCPSLTRLGNTCPSLTWPISCLLTTPMPLMNPYQILVYKKTKSTIVRLLLVPCVSNERIPRLTPPKIHAGLSKQKLSAVTRSMIMRGCSQVYPASDGRDT